MKHVLSFGETLWDLLPDGAVLGGAPLNLAYRATTLGDRGVAVTRLGRDPLGREAFLRMEALGLDRRQVQWDDTHPTGTVPVTVDGSGIPEYSILDDVAYDYIEVTPQLHEAASGADCICFGTLCQRRATSRHTLREILAASPRAVKFYDVNLRKGCYSKDTVDDSLGRADVLKLNEGEAREFAEMFALPRGSPREVARQVRRRWDLDCCVLTLGPEGAFAVSRDGETEVRGWTIQVVDTIGSGDAFSAAFLRGFLRGRPLEECCFFANALGALVARTKGATAPVSVEEIEKFCRRKF